MASVDLNDEELRLLGTYADGPRIWDAAAVFVTVLKLDSRGLIEPAGEGGAYALTPAGRSMLGLHRHEGSYAYPLSAMNGVERGTCRCGEKISRPVAEGVSPAGNRNEWVLE